MFSSPSRADRIEVFADFVELACLLSDRGRYVLADLGSLYASERDSGVPLEDAAFEDAATDEWDEVAVDIDPEIAADDEVEGMLAAVVEELGRRELAAPDAYPFEVEAGGHAIRVCEITGARAVYAFCLLLTEYRRLGKVGDETFRPAGVAPEELFQVASTVAAGGYLGASASFGFPRRILPRNLFSALTEVFVNRIREGIPHRDFLPGHSVRANDADIDVIAWRHFGDRLPGKVILFGQVASGADWEAKSIITATTMLRRLFREYWGGLIFQRCLCLSFSKVLHQRCRNAWPSMQLKRRTAIDSQRWTDSESSSIGAESLKASREL